jgi:[ribosomal protein S5]-alanine N-acetyltransferase
VRELAGDASIARTTASIPHPYEEGMAEEWIRSLPGRFESGDLIWAVVLRPDVLVGSVQLTVESGHERAELGYWIGVPYQGQGYASEAARAACEYAFSRLGLRRVYAHHVAWNPASGRVLEKVGMRREGVLRQHVVARGSVEDMVVYGVLRSDYDV